MPSPKPVVFMINCLMEPLSPRRDIKDSFGFLHHKGPNTIGVRGLLQRCHRQWRSGEEPWAGTKQGIVVSEGAKRVLLENADDCDLFGCDDSFVRHSDIAPLRLVVLVEVKVRALSEPIANQPLIVGFVTIFDN